MQIKYELIPYSIQRPWTLCKGTREREEYREYSLLFHKEPDSSRDGWKAPLSPVAAQLFNKQISPTKESSPHRLMINSSTISSCDSNKWDTVIISHHETFLFQLWKEAQEKLTLQWGPAAKVASYAEYPVNSYFIINHPRRKLLPPPPHTQKPL